LSLTKYLHQVKPRDESYVNHVDRIQGLMLLPESANTDSADVNEIMFGYYMTGTWANFVDFAKAQKQLEIKKKKIGQKAYDSQDEKAKAMADEVIAWSKKNGYSGVVQKVWWTARPGVLSRAVGRTVDSRKNPTDVLIGFSGGEFLGVSAKSTKKQGDIGFKNPGMGTVERKLGISLSQIPNTALETLLGEFPTLSKSSKARKEEIRSDPKIKSRAEELGRVVLSDIADVLLKTVSSKSDVLDYLLDDWLDAKDEVYPRYIKVTGMRRGAKVEDPLANSKISALASGDIEFVKIGNDSVGVLADGKKILKMRAKYESQKLASSMKFSGDPWK
jgi:hypothetical protein